MLKIITYMCLARVNAGMALWLKVLPLDLDQQAGVQQQGLWVLFEKNSFPFEINSWNKSIPMDAWMAQRARGFLALLALEQKEWLWTLIFTCILFKKTSHVWVKNSDKRSLSVSHHSAAGKGGVTLVREAGWGSVPSWEGVPL